MESSIHQFLEQNLDHELGVYAEQVTDVAHAKLKPTIFRFSTLICVFLRRRGIDDDVLSSISPAECM